MESETGAKIEILGRGTKSFRRDGRGEDEPLHAYVTSTNPEAVKKAVDKIRNIIKQAVSNNMRFERDFHASQVDVPEGQNDLRRRSRSSSSDKNRPPMIKVNDKVMIPQEEHPEIDFKRLLIGPRGNTLKCK